MKFYDTYENFTKLNVDFIKHNCISSTLTFDDFEVKRKISASFEPVQNLEISNFAMAKVEKVNIAVTQSVYNNLYFPVSILVYIYFV